MQQDIALVWTYLPHLLPATKKPRIHKSKTGFMDARDTRFGNLPAVSLPALFHIWGNRWSLFRCVYRIYRILRFSSARPVCR